MVRHISFCKVLLLLTCYVQVSVPSVRCLQVCRRMINLVCSPFSCVADNGSAWFRFSLQKHRVEPANSRSKARTDASRCCEFAAFQKSLRKICRAFRKVSALVTVSVLRYADEGEDAIRTKLFSVSPYFRTTPLHRVQLHDQERRGNTHDLLWLGTCPHPCTVRAQVTYLSNKREIS